MDLPTSPSPLRRLGDATRRYGVFARKHLSVSVALLVVVGIAASLLGARTIARSDAAKARLAFRGDSDEIASSLRLSLQHEEDLVVSASAFFTSNPGAPPADFDRWVEAVDALQRYPELENIGIVVLVPRLRLPAFERRVAADPLRPLGSDAPASSEPPHVYPSGQRPYYCLAQAGMARSPQSELPPSTDYCALSPQLALDRAYGLAGYAPFIDGKTTTLGIETPVYRSRSVPATAAAREQAFVGWLGELLDPAVVLRNALRGRGMLAVSFRYDARFSHVAFSSGSPPPGAQTYTIPLLVGPAALVSAGEGWTVQTFGPPVSSGAFADLDSLSLAAGGTLLSLMLGTLLLTLATGRRRALSLVSERTHELSRKNAQLSHVALHDSLTGLPNRTLVLDRAEQLLARTARRQGALAGALFVDVDGFKRVNDSLGHAAGDQLLSVVGKRLLAAARRADTVGRLGGDEFVVLVESADRAALDALADRLTDALRKPVELGDRRAKVSVTVSIGAALGRYATPDALLRDSDLALYAAKAQGKDRYLLFEPRMHGELEDQLTLEADLAVALAEGQLFLVYQPVFDLRTNRPVAVEALIRWRHPERGVLLPERFIPLAEHSGLIVSIGSWVLGEACSQAATWVAHGLEAGVAVNVSAAQLERSEFVADVRTALRRSGLDPALLSLEITETALIHDLAAAREQLEAVRALGVRVAIDDFGTGYASLSNLQRVPFDTLKVDKSFVAAIAHDERSREIVRGMLRIGQGLSLTVIAEGIERQPQLRELQKMGCGLGQGFLLARPAPPALLEGMFAGRLASVHARRGLAAPAAKR